MITRKDAQVKARQIRDTYFKNTGKGSIASAREKYIPEDRLVELLLAKDIVNSTSRKIELKCFYNNELMLKKGAVYNKINKDSKVKIPLKEIYFCYVNNKLYVTFDGGSKRTFDNFLRDNNFKWPKSLIGYKNETETNDTDIPSGMKFKNENKANDMSGKGDMILLEGGVTEIKLTKYERSGKAREECLSHYGYSCAVCGFNFEEVYGSIGERYIHVHHIVPLADKKEKYEVDPTDDLIPVCPNCHAMIHVDHKNALTIEQLRKIIQTNRHT